MTRNLPSLTDAKAEARQMRDAMRDRQTPITHSESLERVAHWHGFRDWNSFRAAIMLHFPGDWAIGQHVSGSYLSQPFQATVRGAHQMRPGWCRLDLDLDDPIDVVTFDSFSNLRKRLQVVIGPKGHSRERTSDGLPHAVLHSNPVKT